MNTALGKAGWAHGWNMVMPKEYQHDASALTDAGTCLRSSTWTRWGTVLL
jgi:hypothetical protein